MKTIKITEGVHLLINQWKAKKGCKTLSEAICDIYLEYEKLKAYKGVNNEK